MFISPANKSILSAARKSDEMLEPYEWKRSRTVLRREGASNRPDLVDYSWSEYRFAAGAAEDGQRYPRCKQADPGAERYPSENSRPVCRLQPSVGRRRIRGKRGAKGELTAVSSPFWSEKGSCTGAAPSVRTGFSPQRRRTGRPAPRRRRQNR